MALLGTLNDLQERAESNVRLEVQTRLTPERVLDSSGRAHWQCPYCLLDTEDLSKFEVVAARTAKCPKCGEISDIRRLEWTALASPEEYAFWVYHSARRKVRWLDVKEWLWENEVADEFWKEYKSIREQLKRT